MMRIGSAAVAAILLLAGPALAQTSTSPGTSGAGATKMSQADCTAAWNQLDTGKTGSVTQAQAQSAIANFSSADTNSDGKLTQAEFSGACSKGLVNAGAGSRALTPGSSTTAPTPSSPSTTPGGNMRK